VADVTNAFTTAIASVILALVAAFAFVPDVREWLGSPDGLVTWATSATLVLAVITGWWAAHRSTTEGASRLLLPVSAAVMLGQNLRFGADLFGYPLPTMSGIEVGSLIDLRRVVSLAAERLGLGAMTGGLILLIVVGATAFGILRARRWADNRVLVTESPAAIWLVAALGAAIAVPVLGFFGESAGAWFATAMAGLGSAGLQVVAGMTAGNHRRTVAGWRRRIWPWIAESGPLTGMPSDQSE
jgi:hypothetical protein